MLCEFCDVDNTKQCGKLQHEIRLESRVNVVIIIIIVIIIILVVFISNNFVVKFTIRYRLTDTEVAKWLTLECTIAKPHKPKNANATVQHIQKCETAKKRMKKKNKKRIVTRQTSMIKRKRGKKRLIVLKLDNAKTLAYLVISYLIVKFEMIVVCFVIASSI